MKDLYHFMTEVTRRVMRDEKPLVILAGPLKGYVAFHEDTALHGPPNSSAAILLRCGWRHVCTVRPKP